MLGASNAVTPTLNTGLLTVGSGFPNNSLCSVLPLWPLDVLQTPGRLVMGAPLGPSRCPTRSRRCRQQRTPRILQVGGGVRVK